MEVLLHERALRVNAIEPIMELTSGAISGAVDRLVRRRLVRRREEAQNRRERVGDLTLKGRAIIDRGFREHCKAMETAAASLSAMLMRLLKKVGKGAVASFK